MAVLHSIHPVECEVGAKGTTVRRGPKWYYNTDQALDLCYCSGEEHEVVGHARVLTRMLLPFNTITDEMLKEEHEISSRATSGLLESMRRAYGDDFNENEVCTILSYWRTD